MASLFPLDAYAKQLLARMPGGRVTLKTDISQFYASIYTHAVDWSIRGKGLAKRNLHASGLGPDLDKQLRNSRLGQTIGIPVGPDTSWLIAEVLLARIDAEMQSRVPSVLQRAVRYSDDMTFYASSRGEAEDALACYQRVLHEYELALNPGKVQVIDGLEALEARWVQSLRAHPYRDTSDARLANDLIGLIDLALELRQIYSTQAVLGYTIKRCDPFPGGKDSWPIYRNFVLAAMSVDPSTLPHAYQVLLFASENGLPIRGDDVAAILNGLLGEHARLDHGFETAWILSMIRDLDLPLDLSAASTVSEMDDNCSLVLLGDLAHQRPSIGARLDLQSPVRRAEADQSLSSSDWLLAYEFRHRGWARPRKWDGSPLWKALHQNGTSFYLPHASAALSRLRRRRPSFLPNWAYRP